MDFNLKHLARPVQTKAGEFDPYTLGKAIEGFDGKVEILKGDVTLIR